jgi:two-component system phosphate regulon response regulator PhoB
MPDVFVSQPTPPLDRDSLMARILVVEDEADIQEVLEYNLKREGHDVVVTSTAKQGLRLARERRPDLVLLDLMLPDGSGTELCKALRLDSATRGVRVVMLTAKGEEIDRVIGFELGADDYIVKPFSMRELLLRVQAVLRRATSEEGEATTQFGMLRIDQGAHRVWVEGGEVELTALEFRLLLTLHDRRNRVQTRDALLSDVWKIDADVTTRTVDTHVKRLREKLGQAGVYIQTVRGVGYRFAERPDEPI